MGEQENQFDMSSSLDLPPPSATIVVAKSTFLFDPTNQGPIRAVLLGLERLDWRARELAQACVLAPSKRRASPLLKQFVENQRPGPGPA